MNQPYPVRSALPYPHAGDGAGGPANLADILERVLDKGIVIAGDIRVDLLDIELLTIRLRLLVASVDRAREMGIDWWESDPTLSSAARRRELAAQDGRADEHGERAEQTEYTEHTVRAEHPEHTEQTEQTEQTEED